MHKHIICGKLTPSFVPTGTISILLANYLVGYVREQSISIPISLSAMCSIYPSADLIILRFHIYINKSSKHQVFL